MKKSDIHVGIAKLSLIYVFMYMVIIKKHESDRNC